jgi:RHS repeat-associated protein
MGDWAFQYDTLNRLTVAAPALNAPNSPSNYRNTVACFGYDGFGNRTVAAFSPSSDCTKDTTATASYNSTNQVTFVSQAAPIATSAPSGFTYDAAGDVVADANNSYAYDGEGRLCAVYNSLTKSQTQYVYDASGGRVAKASFTGTFPPKNTVCAAPGVATGFSATAYYLLDQGGDQVTELNGSGAWQHSNVWAGSHLDATYDAKGLHFHLADPLGTRRIQTNIDGQVEESCQSLPFGDNLNCTTTALTTADDATEHHFTGKEHDAESGNDYFDARYYSSTMGRFMSPDWSAQEEPVPYAQLDDPQSLNLYAYVLNNPLSRVDADGHTDWDSVIVSSTTTAGVLAGAIIGGGGGGAGGSLVCPGVGTIAGGYEGALAGGAVGGMMGAALGKGIIGALDYVHSKSGKNGSSGSSEEPTRKDGGSKTEPNLPKKTVVKGDDVEIKHFTRSGDHGPAHLHVEGGGSSTKIGMNGKPISGSPELSSPQQSVVNNNLSQIRSAVDKIQRWFSFNKQ